MLQEYLHELYALYIQKLQDTPQDHQALRDLLICVEFPDHDSVQPHYEHSQWICYQWKSNKKFEDI